MRDLIDPQAMRSAMGALASAVPASGGFGGRSLLKVEKHTGLWVYGAESHELGGMLVAVDPESFEHGWVVWDNSAVQAESMVPLNQTPLEKAPGADAQLSFTAAVVDGDNAGTQLLYKSSSKGGKEFVGSLAGKIALADPAKDCPVVTLSSGSYRHRSYGKIYTPSFNIERWTSKPSEATQAVLESAPSQPEPEPETPAPVRTRRSRSA